MNLELFKPKSAADDKFKTNLPPGSVACHVFFVPMYIHHDVPGKVAGSTECINSPGAGFIPCIREECNLWNKSKGACGDRLAKDALLEIRDSLQALREVLKNNVKATV